MLGSVLVPGEWRGKNWNQSTSKKRSCWCWHIFLAMYWVPCSSRATFQNKPQWAEHVTAKKGKNQQETTTRLSRLRRRRKRTRSKRKTNVTLMMNFPELVLQHWLGSMLFPFCVRRTHPGDTAGLVEERLTRREHTEWQNRATSLNSTQTCPNGTFSPLHGVKQN